MEKLGRKIGLVAHDAMKKEYPDHKWYYMFLRNRELKRYIEIFTGRRAVMINIENMNLISNLLHTHNKELNRTRMGNTQMPN